MKKGIWYKGNGVRLKATSLLWVFCTLACINAFSQKVSISLDRDKIVIGEQVTLQFKITDVNPRISFLANAFSFPDSSNHFTVLKRDALDTVDAGGLSTYFQNITITSFDSGRWVIPRQVIILQDRETGKQATVKSDSAFLQVLPVDVSGLKDYHDIKDIIDVTPETDYTLIIAAGISAVILTVLIILLLRRKKRPAKVVKKAPKNMRPPLEEALLKLNELEKEGLQFTGRSKVFYTRLDDICREYFTNRTQINAPLLTSSELAVALGVYLQNKDAREKYTRLYQLINAVKFAKYTPAPEEYTEALQLAAYTLQHIDQQIQITLHAN